MHMEIVTTVDSPTLMNHTLKTPSMTNVVSNGMTTILLLYPRGPWSSKYEATSGEAGGHIKLEKDDVSKDKHNGGANPLITMMKIM